MALYVTVDISWDVVEFHSVYSHMLASNTVTKFIVSLVSYVFGTLWQAIR